MKIHEVTKHATKTFDTALFSQNIFTVRHVQGD